MAPNGWEPLSYINTVISDDVRKYYIRSMIGSSTPGMSGRRYVIDVHKKVLKN